MMNEIILLINEWVKLNAICVKNSATYF